MTIEVLGNSNRIDCRGQHSHLVSRDAVHILCRTGNTAEKVTAADDNSNLGSALDGSAEFGADKIQHALADAEVLISHQGFSAQLQ
jgi:hypothetical protein